MPIDTIAKGEAFLLRLDAMRGPVPNTEFMNGNTALFSTFYLHNDPTQEEHGVLVNDDATPIDLTIGWDNGQWEHRVMIVSANNYDRLWIAAQYNDFFGRGVRLKVRDRYFIRGYGPATMDCDGDDIAAYIFTFDNIPALSFVGEDMYIGTTVEDPVTGLPIQSANGLHPPVSPAITVPYDIRAWTHADDDRIPSGVTWYGVNTALYGGTASPNHAGTYRSPLQILLNSNLDEENIGIRCVATHEEQEIIGGHPTEVDCPPTPSPSPSPSGSPPTPSPSPSPSGSPPTPSPSPSPSGSPPTPSPSPSPSGSPTPQPCPADCSGCPNTLTATVVGSSGCPGGGNIDGVYTLTRVGCDWFGNLPNATAHLWCTVDEWGIQFTTIVPAAIFSADNFSGCPPLGVYTNSFCSCTNCGTCTVS